MAQAFSIDASHPMPLYAQLERSIRFAVATGRLQLGEQLPTVRQMAVDLRINANTVAKVYAELERAGIVETRRGIGTFVTARRGQNQRPSRSRKATCATWRTAIVAEAEAHGYSLDDLIEHLHARRKRTTASS